MFYMDVNMSKYEFSLYIDVIKPTKKHEDYVFFSSNPEHHST